MLRRRTPAGAALGLVVLLLSGCGSQAAPGAVADTTPVGQNAVPGTRPSTSLPTATDPTTAATTAPAAATTPTSLPSGLDFPQPSTLVDGSSGDFVMVDLTAGSSSRGQIAAGVHGVGMAWGAGRATLSKAGDGSVSVTYRGRGYLDAHASLDPPMFLDALQHGRPAHVSLRLTARYDPSRTSGTATVWVNGTAYHVTAGPTAHDALPTARTVLGHLHHGDWAAVYRMSDHSLQQAVTLAAFVRTMSSKHVTVSEARITGPIVYTTSGGIPYARVPIHETATFHGRRLSAAATMILVREQGAWRYDTTQ